MHIRMVDLMDLSWKCVINSKFGATKTECSSQSLTTENSKSLIIPEFHPGFTFRNPCFSIDTMPKVSKPVLQIKLSAFTTKMTAIKHRFPTRGGVGKINMV